MEWTKKELLSLPHRNCENAGVYNAIMIVPTRRLHDSGWRLMCLVGCDEHYEPKEIIGYCDDINLCTEKAEVLNLCHVQMDMIPKTNVVRIHSHVRRFQVGMCCSTTEIFIV